MKIVATRLNIEIYEIRQLIAKVRQAKAVRRCLTFSSAGICFTLVLRISARREFWTDCHASALHLPLRYPHAAVTGENDQ
ncbi:hypothetical protein ACG1VR_00075 (plasmid) [Cedecea davisae]